MQIQTRPFSLLATWYRLWSSSKKTLPSGRLSAGMAHLMRTVIVGGLSCEIVTLIWFQALPQDFVENAVRLLVTRFIPLKPSDLESWMSDPEEWVNLEDRENELWEFELRVSLLNFSFSFLTALP
jgi:hypothetical protein